MRKTKIVCTLGPSTDNPEILRQMIEAGMDVARFNFSHGSYEEHRARLDNLIALREELGRPVAALLDTKGPEIRLQMFENGREVLEAGQTFTLTTRDILGTKEICSITYKDLPRDLSVGGTVMLDDGLIRLTVTDLTDTDIVCRVENGGPIKDRKGVNVPGIHLSMPYMSAKDREDIIFGVENGFDFIAASFVRTAQDVNEIRRVLDERGSKIRIIAKIENQEGVDNIDAILAAADGVMVARGDMGVEIEFTEIPLLQKDIIFHSFSSGKPVITATQMLDSMMNNPRPTRAEITDVANAIYDGTSAIMLSGETAAGKYPVESVRTMAAIADRVESDSSYMTHLRKAVSDTRLGVSAATAHAACLTATDINASAIITVSKSGGTARTLSSFRPITPIVACVMDEQVRRQLSLNWGVTPLIMPYAHSTDELIEGSVNTALKAGLVAPGEMAVVTAGVPVGVSGTTNMIKAHLVGNSLITGVGVGNKNAKGTLCICRDLADIRAKYQAGMVLVLPRTDNDILPHIKDAAALIVEEGGMNSHAAIVGQALGMAVLVGATNATRKLVDGTKVTIDCAHGTVQTLGE